jgi:hypothetical protein
MHTFTETILQMKPVQSTELEDTTMERNVYLLSNVSSAILVLLALCQTLTMFTQLKNMVLLLANKT